MNQAFYSLPQEKQQAIYNASMEVFSKWEYKRASTDLIAAKAGVSKGLLFYYFHNKRTLYMETFAHARQRMEDFLGQTGLMGCDDFFQRLSWGAQVKIRALEREPFLLDFCVRAYYSLNEEISAPIRSELEKQLGGMYASYVSGLDLSRFKPGVDPVHVLRMLAWMTDGYVHMRQLEGGPLDLAEVTAEVDGWMKMFRQMFYKEEEQ